MAAAVVHAVVDVVVIIAALARLDKEVVVKLLEDLGVVGEGRGDGGEALEEFDGAGDESFEVHVDEVVLEEGGRGHGGEDEHVTELTEVESVSHEN